MWGLTSQEAKERQQTFGKNEMTLKDKHAFFIQMKRIISEPMFALLLLASSLYFLLRQWRDGVIMLVFVSFVIAIHLLQERKADHSLQSLRQLTQPQVTVYRDGEKVKLPSADLVPGDCVQLFEGNQVPADGKVLQSNDLCIDESLLTGESQGVYKTPQESGNLKANQHWQNDRCYAGTLVIRGSALMEVERIGNETICGKIGMQIAETKRQRTPLQSQMNRLVKICTEVALALFVLVTVLTFFSVGGSPLFGRLSQSFLSGVTLAMAMIPEEFPVILTVFFSVGAYRLAKKQSLVRHLPAVETLGEISTLCIDKTGTITTNQAQVEKVYLFKKMQQPLYQFLTVLGLACEDPVYDPLEKAILQYCALQGIALPERKLLQEYSFTNEDKRMAHAWKTESGNILAAKGAPESIMELCMLSKSEREEIKKEMESMSKKGLRILAVASAQVEKCEPNLKDYRLTFRGLIGLQDPPREGMAQNIRRCLRAGIQVVMITGDHSRTASVIARKVGIPHYQQTLTGEQIESMDDDTLAMQARTCGVFARVTPEHKTRIIKALKKNGRVVAMTGDGVNDAPALRYADIGIAMGKRGSDVAREAADLVLLDDDFSTIVDTIEDGRRIYDNIKKAVGYVLAIHIPIALISLLCPFLGIAQGNAMLLPAIIVLLELVIDPTCSIILERQKAESDIMSRPPRSAEDTILSKPLVVKSLLQGFVIFAASFDIYLIELTAGHPQVARTLGVLTLLFSYLLLVWVNSSVIDSILVSGKKLAQDKGMWISSGCVLLGMILVVYTPLHTVFHLAPIPFASWARCFFLSVLSVIWYEGVKWLKRSWKEGNT